MYCIITPVLKDTNKKGVEELKIKLESVELPETEVIIRGDVTSEEVVSLLQMLKKRNTGKIILYKEEEQYIVDANEIVFIEVCDNKVFAYTKADAYEVKQKLYEIKALLSAQTFAQINKSVIVNINCVKSIQAEFSGNYRIKLKNRKESLTISRKYFKEFKDRI
jgi:DNA-binding LytR/AlgR family response regulator